MYSLKNDLLQVNIKHKGVELCSISAIKNTNEFLWQADPEIWGSHAPNLFPIIGCMNNNNYIYNDKTYTMPKHGFVRHNEDFKVKTQTKDCITFQLTSNETLYQLYPFNFQFEITYLLNDNTLTIQHSINNLDDKIMYFSVGGHPAFNCPLYTDEDYTDYILEFNKNEQSESYLLELETGLITSQTKAVFNTKNAINLRPDLFNEDALIFKDLISRSVSLKHKTKGKVLTVDFNDFNYLGIWAKPNAPYVCIEPWLGIADNTNTNLRLEDKEGILNLKLNETFNASYSIEIEKTHLG